MRKVSLLFIIVGMVIASCTALQTAPAPTEAPLLFATETRVSTPTTMPSSTPTSVSTPAPAAEPTHAPLYPALEKLCPANPLVSLSRLGLDPRTRLLVTPDTLETLWDEDRIGIFVIAPDDLIPRQMDYLFQEGFINSGGISVSPDGRWFIFDRKAIGQETRVSWMSSLDGQQQWPLSMMEDNLGAAWLDHETVLLYDADHRLRKLINPFTMEEELLTHLPEADIVGIGAIFFRDSGRTFMLYQGEGYDYRLFDLSTRTDQQVLEWLSAEDVPFLAKGISAATDGRISIKVVRPYGFDMSPLMQVSEVIASANYTQTMQPVFLPESILPAEPSWETTVTSSMAVYNDSEQDPNPAPQFYWFDYSQRIITDYCFAPLGSASISPDGKFVAFTRFHLPSIGPAPKSIFVLNLETGYITQIDGYQFEGWGWADE